MDISKGDIVKISFPFTDGSGTKIRPALVLSNESIHNTGDVLLAQITTRLRKDGFSIEISDSDVTVPLPLKSFIRVHKIFLLDRSLVLGKISHLKNAKYQAAAKALCELIK